MTISNNQAFCAPFGFEILHCTSFSWLRTWKKKPSRLRCWRGRAAWVGCPRWRRRSSPLCRPASSVRCVRNLILFYSSALKNISSLSVHYSVTPIFITAKLSPVHNNGPIESTTTKFFGIMLDTHFTWREHVESVCQKINKFVYAIYRLKISVSKKSGLMAYHG